jgi:hypothetical protein
MADPVLTGVRRVLAVFQRQSGLPEDVVVNSWAFVVNAGFTPDPNIFRDVLDAFYSTVHAGETTSVRDHMHPSLTSLSYRIYDLGQLPPREPTIVPSVLWIKPTGSPLPEECSVVLSFYADRNLPRKRGRLYIGPLDSGTLQSMPDGATRPNLAVRSAIRAGAINVMNTSQPVGWSVVSQVNASSHIITAGWVDDAYDTQRRRGPAATSRILFPIPT